MTEKLRPREWVIQTMAKVLQCGPQDVEESLDRDFAGNPTLWTGVVDRAAHYFGVPVVMNACFTPRHLIVCLAQALTTRDLDAHATGHARADEV